MAQSGFTVACISDRDKSIYPNNVGSHYTVKLPKALNFSSATLNESTSKWEVAMMDCNYLHNFYNFRQGCTLRIIIAMPPESEIDTSEAQSPACLQVNNRTQWSKFPDQIGKQLLKTFVMIRDPDTRIMDAHTGLYGVVYVPAAYYSSASALLDHLTNEFNRRFEPRYNQRLSASINADGVVSLSTTSGNAVAIFADTPYIANVLGLRTKELTINLFIDYKEVPVKLHGLIQIGVRPPRLDRVQALQICVDIIENQYVGNTMSQLVDYVDVPDSLGAQVSHMCDPMVHLPLCRSVIDTITIHICDERGNDVVFPDDVSNVMVRLHFRESAT